MAKARNGVPGSSLVYLQWFGALEPVKLRSLSLQKRNRTANA
jgi:hypothetical protein